MPWIRHSSGSTSTRSIPYSVLRTGSTNEAVQVQVLQVLQVLQVGITRYLGTSRYYLLPTPYGVVLVLLVVLVLPASSPCSPHKPRSGRRRRNFSDPQPTAGTPRTPQPQRYHQVRVLRRTPYCDRRSPWAMTAWAASARQPESGGAHRRYSVRSPGRRESAFREYRCLSR